MNPKPYTLRAVASSAAEEFQLKTDDRNNGSQAKLRIV